MYIYFNQYDVANIDYLQLRILEACRYFYLFWKTCVPHLKKKIYQYVICPNTSA